MNDTATSRSPILPGEPSEADSPGASADLVMALARV
jgi:hypothetical protein